MVKVSAGGFLLRAVGGASAPHFSFGFWWFAGSPRASLACRHMTYWLPVSAFVFKWHFPCVCVCVEIFISKKAPVISDLGAHFIPI